MRVTVKQINADGSLMVARKGDPSGQIHRIPADFRHYLHGYAVTAHASQGATVESVAVLGDGMKRELFYVAVTRGKSEINIYTEDRTMMEQQVKVSGERKSGIEAIKTAQSVANMYMKSRFQILQQQLKIGTRKIVKHIRKTAFRTITNANKQYRINQYYEHRNKGIRNYIGQYPPLEYNLRQKPCLSFCQIMILWPPCTAPIQRGKFCWNFAIIKSKFPDNI